MSHIIEWTVLVILLLVLVAVLIAELADFLRTTRNGAKAEIELHRARTQVALGRHRHAVRRDAERVKREIEDELG